MKIQVITSLQINGELLLPNTISEIEDSEAKRLIELGVVKSAEETKEEPVQDTGSSNEEIVTLEQVTEELTQVNGINEDLAEALFDIDILSIQDLKEAEVSELTKISGVGTVTAKKLIAAAKKTK